MSKPLKIALSLILLLVFAAAGTLAYYNFTYSEGARAGVLVKFSKRGFLFKTYEGELNMGGVGNLPNTAQANQIWHFSVVDADVAAKIRTYEGQRVVLDYVEKIKAMPWQGESNYFVTDVKPVSP